ncbi:MAG TPA: AAA family ATPase [Myxococcaceae bacterium]|nr:AAA family ATPase [Myxococcaceae bacterium]
MRHLESLRLRNFLSFGPDSGEIPLGDLNVIIGPNGSGKSNLIEAIRVLRACARDDLARVIREGGGFSEWRWKGAKDSEVGIEAVSEGTHHNLALAAAGHSFEIVKERVESTKRRGKVKKPGLLLAREGGRLRVMREGKLRNLDLKSDLAPHQSAMCRFDDRGLYPELAGIAFTYKFARIYRDWHFGRNSPVRLPQPADLIPIDLDEDGGNLGLVLNSIRRDSASKNQLRRWLDVLYEGIRDVDVSVMGGTIQVFLQEQDWTVPATRLSEGTLRWLCLVAIALRSHLQFVVCIEEPETGLHPDLLPSLAELLREASRNLQLIVTTHSDVLVDALTDTPEAILVCDKEDGQTKMRRLSRKKLGTWLDKYRLGELWRRGQIGGNRW